MSDNLGASFQHIPNNWIPPLFYVEFNNTLAGVQGSIDQPTLLIGQMSTSGQAEPDVPVLVPSTGAAIQLFGPNSQLTRMITRYLNADSAATLYALPLNAAANAAQAKGTYTFAGAATGAGTIYIDIGNIEIQVGVNAGDTAAEIASNAAAAITATALVPVAASAAAAILTVTAIDAGLQGNNIVLAINMRGLAAGQVMPGGVTVTIAPMTGGATDPDLGGVATAIGDQVFDFIGHPYGEAIQMAEMTATMNDTSGRWAWNRQVYGHVWTATPGTITSLMTFAGTLNDQHSDLIGIIGYQADPVDFVPAWIGAVAASIRNLPSQPLQTLALPGIIGAPVQSRLTLAQENTLMAAGVALPRTDTYGNVTIGQDVSTYKTNAQGIPDASYRYPTTMFTLMAITRQLKSALVTKFGRCIYVQDGTVTNPFVPAVTNTVIAAEILAQYIDMQANGLVQNAAAMAAATVVQQHPNNPNRVDIIWRPELANGLTMMAVINQFVLNPAIN